MIVPEFPIVGIRDLFSKSKSRFYSEMQHKMIFTFLGRGAVFQAIEALELKTDDIVLVPSYHCGVEIEAILMNNARIQYYNINKNLQIDMQDFEKKIINGNVKAALIIHYYGFPQDIVSISKLCRKKNVVLIEDCSHSHLSHYGDKRLGTFGDLAIFSFRKMLPLSNGGGLLMNRKYPINEKEAVTPGRFFIAKSAIGSYLRYHRSMVHLYNAFQLVNSRLRAGRFIVNEQTPSTGMGVSEINCRTKISPSMKNIIKHCDDLKIEKLRRTNYILMQKTLHKQKWISEIYERLENGNVPLCFPLRINNGKRDEFERILKDKGVQSYIFGKNLHPSLSREKYRDAHLLSAQIIGIPIHQKINQATIVKIAGIINRTEL